MFFVYMLSSKPYGTLYTGMTSDLPRRAWEHKNKVVSGFTAKYWVDRPSGLRRTKIRYRRFGGSGRTLAAVTPSAAPP